MATVYFDEATRRFSKDDAPAVEPVPPTSQPAITENRQLTVVLSGNTILGEREYIRTRLADEIKQAVGDRVDFGLEVSVAGGRG